MSFPVFHSPSRNCKQHVKSNQHLFSVSENITQSCSPHWTLLRSNSPFVNNNVCTWERPSNLPLIVLALFSNRWHYPAEQMGCPALTRAVIEMRLLHGKFCKNLMFSAIHALHTTKISQNECFESQIYLNLKMCWCKQNISAKKQSFELKLKSNEFLLQLGGIHLCESTSSRPVS